MMSRATGARESVKEVCEEKISSVQMRTRWQQK
jgi:hypothetical protein